MESLTEPVKHAATEPPAAEEPAVKRPKTVDARDSQNGVALVKPE
jgi:hypothetical protein